MEKIIAGRHIDIDDEIKEFIQKELGKLEKGYHKLTSARVVLDKQKNWYLTEIILHGKNISIESKSKSKDLRSAISNSLSKTKGQLKKFLDKIQNHHSR